MDEHPLGRLISEIYNAQPPEWRLGIHVAQHILCALEQSSDEHANTAGAILLSYIALAKTEGYAAGVLSVIGEIRKKATPDGELAGFLDEMNEKLFEERIPLYQGIFAALVQYVHQQDRVKELPEGCADQLRALIESAFPQQ